MEFKMIITPEGKVITEVLDRGAHACSSIRMVTRSIGRELSDEETGPEGATAIELQNG